MRLRLLSRERQSTPYNEVYNGELPTDVLCFFPRTDGENMTHRRFYMGFAGLDGELTIYSEGADSYSIERGELDLKGPLTLKYKYSNHRAHGKYKSSVKIDGMASRLVHYGYEENLLEFLVGRFTQDYIVELKRLEEQVVSMRQSGRPLKMNPAKIQNRLDSLIESDMDVFIRSHIGSLAGIYYSMKGSMTAVGSRDYTNTLEDIYCKFDLAKSKQFEEDMEMGKVNFKKIKLKLSIPWHGDIVATW